LVKQIGKIFGLENKEKKEITLMSGFKLKTGAVAEDGKSGGLTGEMRKLSPLRLM
jgi:hypothetical protein